MTKENRTVNIEGNTFFLAYHSSQEQGERSLKFRLYVNGTITGFRFPTIKSGKQFISRYHKAFT